MSGDEEVIYSTIAALAQAKMGDYSIGLDRLGQAQEVIGFTKDERQAIGADAFTVAEMLVAEEKKVLADLRVQLMSEVNRWVLRGS